MIYTPETHPKEAMILVSGISFVGIVGGLFVNSFLMIFALVFWLQYTAILSYLQFKAKHKHKWNSITEVLLHPQVRFLLFGFLFSMGFFSVLEGKSLYIGAAVLFAWFLFSLNFYKHYEQFKKYG